MEDLRDQFEIAAHPRYAGEARDRIRSLAERAGYAEIALADIEIAVGEAVTNAILYGSPNAASRIVIHCGFSADTFSIEVHDQGRGFDPAQVPENVGSDALGGRGIRLMRALMDSVDLHYDGQGMVARLTKKLS